MDGFAAAEEIRRVDPLVDIIFITGYSMEDPARQALHAGAYAALTKPVDPQELFALMKSVAQ